MRRLPVYLLLDTSGSMRGEPIEAVKVGLQSMLSSLRQDPAALEATHISIISFDREAKVLMPLTSLETFQLPEIEVPQSGPTNMGEALELLLDRMKTEIVKSTEDTKGDWRPLLFLMTDGSPSDSMAYKEVIPKIQAEKFATIVACAAGSRAKTEPLKKLTNTVVSLDTMDSSSFDQFFKWVSNSVSSGNMSMGATTDLALPPPPTEVNVVV